MEAKKTGKSKCTLSNKELIDKYPVSFDELAILCDPKTLISRGFID
jgi:hypothetical protein